MSRTKVACVACGGKGHVYRVNRPTITAAQKRRACKLYQDGLSFRAIARKIGVKHPYTVQYAIKTINQ